MLDRPSDENIVLGAASYGGRFVPVNRVVPNVPIAPNPYVNLAPLQADVAWESIVLKVVAPWLHGLSIQVVNIVGGRYWSYEVEVEEEDIFAPGVWRRVELRGAIHVDDVLRGHVRVAKLDQSDVAPLGPIHDFQIPLQTGTSTPFVWDWIGGVDVPTGWIAFRAPSVSHRSWEA